MNRRAGAAIPTASEIIRRGRGPDFPCQHALSTWDGDDVSVCCRSSSGDRNLRIQLIVVVSGTLATARILGH
jgi:hypothetical protein